MRELVQASRKAKVSGHGSTRTVECPYCNQVHRRTIVSHLRTKHSAKWQQWQSDMLELYNQGLSSMEIARECYMLLSWSLIEREIIKLAEEKKISLAPPFSREIKSWNSDEELQKTTVWKFVRRGSWAVHEGRYRGNWPPQVPNNLIRRYSRKEELILDPFLGGGTTVIESWILGRKSIGIDVSPHSLGLSKKRIAEMANKAPKEKLNPFLKPEVLEGDARNLSFLDDNSVDLICTQPPYLNAVKYTEYNPDDLSHIKNEKEFCKEFRKAANEMFRVLKNGKICAVQIGDTRKDGKFVPLGFLILKELESTGLKIGNMVIKLQYADRSTAFYKNLKELQIAHEYLLIMKKHS